jgi:hypothetical protein
MLPRMGGCHLDSVSVTCVDLGGRSADMRNII